MTPYEQQVESGKEIVREILANLATDLNEPNVKEFTFKMTDQDFDRDRISLVGPNHKIVAKIERDDLADCPEDRAIRGKLKARLQQSVQIFLNN
jgi:hypothetical protein